MCVCSVCAHAYVYMNVHVHTHRSVGMKDRVLDRHYKHLC